MSQLLAESQQMPLAAWTREIKQSTLREVHALLSRPGLLSFALGMPATELFPTAAYGRAARRVLDNDAEALQYGLPLRQLKAQVVSLMARRGVECSEDEVFITSGAQQAMSLLGKVLVSPGDAVVTEELTYDGMLNSLRPLQPRVLTVPSDPETGMDVDALEALLAGGERPSLVYCMPEGHNPLGCSMPARARAQLAEVARLYRVPVIEDDAYGLLDYDDHAAPALRALDPEWVLYIGSFSKIMAPGLRTGWIVAPPHVVQRLSILRQGTDLDVSNFAQRTLLSFLEHEPLEEHLDHLRREYRARRDAMLQALGEHFPDGARWTHPRAGLFVWVDMPDGVDTTALLRSAVEDAGVAYIPGRAFCAAGGVRGGSSMRLNFSRMTVAEIHEGIHRLGQVLRPRPPVVELPGWFSVAADAGVAAGG